MNSLFEELGGTYHQEGDYLLPNLVPPESAPIGIWGQRRRHYLKTHQKAIYTALLISGELDNHLAETNAQAEAMFLQLVIEYAHRQGITELLKAEHQMEWVGRMNIARNRAGELIYHELIYV